eukprot:5887572-Lingulodinium_polyedra.AAC.1
MSAPHVSALAAPRLKRKRCGPGAAVAPAAQGGHGEGGAPARGAAGRARGAAGRSAAGLAARHHAA